jgi:hypothetical protein
MGKDKFTLAPGYKIYGALGLGLATAIAFRALIVINHVHPDWVRPVWYFAVLGNFFFFYHRFRINTAENNVRLILGGEHGQIRPHEYRQNPQAKTNEYAHT